MNAFRAQLVPALIILAALCIGGFVTVASAQSADEAPKGISFPVAELGNCADKASCKAYCDDAANMDACIEFAKKHGLVSNAEAERGKRFASELKQNAGPGGCKTPAECKAHCENVANLNACVEFAKKHKINDRETGEAERIAAYLKAGGAMPGNCTSRESCMAYCGDFANALECRAFAEKAGLAVSQGKNPVPPGQFQKLANLAREGKTPGSCTSKEACEAYCGDPSNRASCIAFGKEAGLIGAREADALTKVGGVGPGGCASKEACHAFCNEEANRETCFAFAKEHNLVPPEDLKRAEESLVRFRQGFDHAPPEAVACLKAHLGENIIEEIQGGRLTPGPEIGETMRACFERFGKKVDVTEEVKRAPANVISCLREKVGTNFGAIQSGRATMTPEIADTIRVCGEHARLQMDFAPKSSDGGSGTGSSGAPDLRAHFNRAPQHVQACLKEKLGTALDASAEAPSEEAKLAFRECYESFKPTAPVPRPMNAAPSASPTMVRFTPEVLACFKGNLSATDYETILKGVKPLGAEAVIGKCMEQAQGNIRENIRENIMERLPLPFQKVLPPVPSAQFRPAVLACLKSHLPETEYLGVLRGVKPQGFEDAFGRCMTVPEPTSVPPPSANVAPVQGETTVTPTTNTTDDTYVAPTNTYVAPTKTYVAPADSYTSPTPIQPAY